MMVRQNCRDCVHAESGLCMAGKRAQTASLGYCFDFSKKVMWRDHIAEIAMLAGGVVAIGVAAALLLHLCVWILEALW